jgi:hypothetical protein
MNTLLNLWICGPLITLACLGCVDESHTEDEVAIAEVTPARTTRDHKWIKHSASGGSSAELQALMKMFQQHSLHPLKSEKWRKKPMGVELEWLTKWGPFRCMLAPTELGQALLQHLLTSPLEILHAQPQMWIEFALSKTSALDLNLQNIIQPHHLKSGDLIIYHSDLIAPQGLILEKSMTWIDGSAFYLGHCDLSDALKGLTHLEVTQSRAPAQSTSLPLQRLRFTIR